MDWGAVICARRLTRPNEQTFTDKKPEGLESQQRKFDLIEWRISTAFLNQILLFYSNTLKASTAIQKHG